MLIFLRGLQVILSYQSALNPRYLFNTLPSVGSINRLIIRTNVDLPLPDSPIITNISPDSTSS